MATPDDAVTAPMLERMVAAGAVDALELEPTGERWGAVAVVGGARYRVWAARGHRRQWSNAGAAIDWLRRIGAKRVHVVIPDGGEP